MSTENCSPGRHNPAVLDGWRSRLHRFEIAKIGLPLLYQPRPEQRAQLCRLLGRAADLLEQDLAGIGPAHQAARDETPALDDSVARNRRAQPHLGAAKSARSAATVVSASGSDSGRTSERTRASLRRASRASAPWPIAGSISVVGKRSLMRRREARAVEPGAGQDSGIDRALGHLAQPRVDVAAQRARSKRSLRAARTAADAAQARRADAAARRQLVQRRAGAADHGVARIGARRDRDQRQPRGQMRGHVLEAVHREIDVAREQLLLDLPWPRPPLPPSSITGPVCLRSPSVTTICCSTIRPRCTATAARR